MEYRGIDRQNRAMEYQQKYKAEKYYKISVIILIILLILLVSALFCVLAFLYNHEEKIEALEGNLRRLEEKQCEY